MVIVGVVNNGCVTVMWPVYEPAARPLVLIETVTRNAVVPLLGETTSQGESEATVVLGHAQ
jgi:hypothetical protein